MPKMKTHSGAKKRFRKTASGKLRGRHSFSTHILEKKAPKRKRRLSKTTEVTGGDRDRIERMLGR
jgi:large subunit ribosomal protein L35